MAKEFKFDVLEHVKGDYVEKLGLTEVQQPYPDRITGTQGDHHVVILIKGVGSDNAGTYRRWVTYGKGDFDGMLSGRPNGWVYYVLMVGLLPDGQPWWSALYEESSLRQKAGFAEPKSGGRFYRFDPGLVTDALIGSYDFTEPVEAGPVPVVDILTVYLCPECRLLADFAPDDPALAGTCPKCGTDSPLFNFDRTWPPVAPEDRAAWDAKAEAYADKIAAGAPVG